MAHFEVREFSHEKCWIFPSFFGSRLPSRIISRAWSSEHPVVRGWVDNPNIFEGLDLIPNNHQTTIIYQYLSRFINDIHISLMVITC